MDNQRLLIWAFFGLMAWMTYQAWVQDHAPRTQPAAQAGAPAQQDRSLPAPANSADLPRPGTAADAPTLPGESVAAAQGDYVRVITDVYDILIATRGADIHQLDLRRYPVAKNPGAKHRLRVADNCQACHDL